MAEVEKSHLPAPTPAPVAHAGHLTALLDYGASFEGRLTFEGTVRIGGNFKGEIFTQDTLVVNPGARVEAQIEADVVIISGTVVGNIFARRRIIMHPPAIFRGTVTSPSLRIDEGVMFEGASYMPKT
jgi:cytoskeletal protein CcmA (bactofilin family)